MPNIPGIDKLTYNSIINQSKDYSTSKYVPTATKKMPSDKYEKTQNRKDTIGGILSSAAIIAVTLLCGKKYGGKIKETAGNLAKGITNKFPKLKNIKFDGIKKGFANVSKAVSDKFPNTKKAIKSIDLTGIKKVLGEAKDTVVKKSQSAFNFVVNIFKKK